MSKENRLFSKRLSRTIMLFAIPVFVVAMGVFYQHAHQLLHKEAIDRSTTILNTTVQLVDNYVSSIETAAQSNVWLLEENFTPDSLAAISHRIVSLNKSVLSCSVCAEPDAFPQYGRYFSAYSLSEGDTVITELEPEYEYFKKNWYKRPMQTGRPCWINPFSDFSEGTINHHDAVGSFCIPLRPHGDRIEGVMSVDFSFQTLRETVFATHHPYPNSYYMLLGPVGGYLIHPETSLLYKKTIFSATDSTQHPDIIALGREMVAGKHGVMHVNLDGHNCYVCYAPVPETGWSMALVCQEDDVLEDYNHLTVVIIVIIVVGLGLIWWLTRKVVQRNIGPLNDLMEATEKITEGNYETVIPATDHKDIVGKMQNAFRKMQLAIIDHAQHVRTMAEQIAAETSELERTLPLAKEMSSHRQQFIQSVKRQIDQPINVVNGLANVLHNKIMSRRGSDADRQEAPSGEMGNIFQTMRYNAIQLHRITLMLYDSSDTGIANATRYDRNDTLFCNDVAQECITRSLKQYPVKNIRFETELADEVSIRSNHNFVTLTLLELIHNAVKYSDGKHITLRVTQTDTTVRFTVEDVGPGLSKEAQKHVFVPFMKVNDQSEGLGLGLPLSNRHVKGLGGQLILDTDYHEGCRFIVELPLEK